MNSISTLKPLVLALALASLLSACGNSETSTTSSADSAGRQTHSNDDGDDHAGEESGTGKDGKDEAGEAERASIDPDIAMQSGIRVAPAQAGTIADEHLIQGVLTPIDGRMATLTARYPGLVRRMDVNVGDKVRAGQTVATLESNLSLSTYPVTSPINGIVTARVATVGGVASEGMPLYQIADLSSLWVDLHVFGSDAQHIVSGAPVSITRIGDGLTVSSTLQMVLPGTATASQSTIARAVLDNTDGLWRPGSAVEARVTVSTRDAALVVPATALQTEDGDDVVFVRTDPSTYEKRVVEPGKRDNTHVEILSGINAGDEVVVEQSYLVKAELGKAGATHAH